MYVSLIGNVAYVAFPARSIQANALIMHSCSPFSLTPSNRETLAPFAKHGATRPEAVRCAQQDRSQHSAVALLPGGRDGHELPKRQETISLACVCFHCQLRAVSGRQLISLLKAYISYQRGYPDAFRVQIFATFRDGLKVVSVAMPSGGGDMAHGEWRTVHHHL